MRERLLRIPVVGTAIRVQERYTVDAADNFAASIAFFGFLSLLPIILLGLSVLGFFLRGDVGLQTQVIDAVRDAVPGLATALGDTSLTDIVEGTRDNATSLLSIGTVTLLFTGLKVIAGSQRALAKVFRMEVPTGVAARGQQLLALALLGLLALLGSAIGGSVGVDVGGGIDQALYSVGLTTLAFAVDLVLFLVAYRLLSPDPGEPPWRLLLPGAIFAAVCWVALKAGGAALFAGGGSDDGSSNVLIAPVGILTILYLAARVFMYGAELAALRGDLQEEAREELGDELGDPDAPSPRPTLDEAPAAADLAKLAGVAAVVGAVVGLADRSRR